MAGPIYLDYNATTPVDPQVVEAMVPYLHEKFGNASSTHAFGQQAREAMDSAREAVGTFLGAHSDEIVFTGGGSETDNLALKGIAFARLTDHPHIIASAVEHPAVLNTLSYLKRRFGVEVTLLPVDEFGLLTPQHVREALRPNTALVSIMHANNEVGTLQPVAEIAEITRAAGVTFHIDAAQAAGKIPLDVEELGVDMLTLAGHKLYAPKGVGVLYVRRGTALDPLVHGSSQEYGLRAGTQNVAGMVALGRACELAQTALGPGVGHMTALRDLLFERLHQRVPELQLNGHPTQRLPNTLNVSFPGISGQAVLACAPEVAASTGSACHSGATEPSPVLMAMGLPYDRAVGAVRLSLGRWTTREEIETASRCLADAYSMLTGRPVPQTSTA